MIGLEIAAPTGYGFVTIHVDSLKKKSTGYNQARSTVVPDSPKVRDEPTKYMITTEYDDVEHFLSATLTDKEGDVVPFATTIRLVSLTPKSVQIPADFGKIL